REELQHLAGAHDVGGADLGHHVGGDEADGLVEAVLRAARPRHDVAQAPQEAPRGGEAGGLLHYKAGGPGPPGMAPPRATIALSACSTTSSMISCVVCSRVTMPTLCPAMSEPVSTSPSTTARRSAPAQKCSISSCASFCTSSPRLKRSMTSRW